MFFFKTMFQNQMAFVKLFCVFKSFLTLREPIATKFIAKKAKEIPFFFFLMVCRYYRSTSRAQYKYDVKYHLTSFIIFVKSP